MCKELKLKIYATLVLRWPLSVYELTNIIGATKNSVNSALLTMDDDGLLLAEDDHDLLYPFRYRGIIAPAIWSECARLLLRYDEQLRLPLKTVL